MLLRKLLRADDRVATVCTTTRGLATTIISILVAQLIVGPDRPLLTTPIGTAVEAQQHRHPRHHPRRSLVGTTRTQLSPPVRHHPEQPHEGRQRQLQQNSTEEGSAAAAAAAAAVQILLPEFPDFYLEELETFPEQRGYVPIEFPTTAFPAAAAADSSGGAGNPTTTMSSSIVGTTELFVVTKSHGNPASGQIYFPSHIRGGGWEQIIYAGDDDKAVELWLRRISSNTTTTTNGDFDSSNAPSKSVVRIILDRFVWAGATAGKGMPYGECVQIENKLGTKWNSTQLVNNNNNNNKGNGKKQHTITSSPIPLHEQEQSSSLASSYLVVFGSDNRGTSEYVGVKSIHEGTDDPSFFYITSNPYFFDPSLQCRRRGALASVQLFLENPALDTNTDDDDDDNSNSDTPESKIDRYEGNTPTLSPTVMVVNNNNNNAEENKQEVDILSTTKPKPIKPIPVSSATNIRNPLTVSSTVKVTTEEETDDKKHEEESSSLSSVWESVQRPLLTTNDNINNEDKDKPKEEDKTDLLLAAADAMMNDSSSYTLVQHSACGYWDIDKDNNDDGLVLQSCFVSKSITDEGVSLKDCQLACSIEPDCYAISIHRSSQSACFLYVNTISTTTNTEMTCSSLFSTNKEHFNDEENTNNRPIPVVRNCHMIGPTLYTSYDCYYNTYALIEEEETATDYCSL